MRGGLYLPYIESKYAKMMEEIGSIVSCPKLRLLHFYVRTYHMHRNYFRRETEGFPRLKRPKIVKNPLTVIYSSYPRTRRMGIPLEKVEKMKDMGWSTISQVFHNQVFGESIPRFSLSLARMYFHSFLTFFCFFLFQLITCIGE